MNQKSKFTVSYKEVIPSLLYMLYNIAIVLFSFVCILVTIFGEYWISMISLMFAAVIAILAIVINIKILISKTRLDYYINRIKISLYTALQSIMYIIFIILICIDSNGGVDGWLIEYLVEMSPAFIALIVIWIVNNNLKRRYLFKYILEKESDK